MSYPTSKRSGKSGTNYLIPEVRGGGRDELPPPGGQEAAGRGYPTSEIRGGRTKYLTPRSGGGGQGRLSHAGGQGQQPRRTTSPEVRGAGREELPLPPRSREAGKNLMPEVRALAERSYPTC